MAAALRPTSPNSLSPLPAPTPPVTRHPQPFGPSPDTITIFPLPTRRASTFTGGSTATARSLEARQGSPYGRSFASSSGYSPPPRPSDWQPRHRRIRSLIIHHSSFIVLFRPLPSASSHFAAVTRDGDLPCRSRLAADKPLTDDLIAADLVGENYSWRVQLILFRVEVIPTSQMDSGIVIQDRHRLTPLRQHRPFQLAVRSLPRYAISPS